MKNRTHTAVTDGKYLISPVTQMLQNGWFACSVLIESCAGRPAGGRLLRLTRMFRSSVAAADYAVAEGLRWVAAAPPLPLDSLAARH